MNCKEATYHILLTFTTKEKQFFLKEYQNTIIKAAVDAMHTIGDKGAVCMVCIVKTLGLDVASLKSEVSMKQILNSAVGKT